MSEAVAKLQSERRETTRWTVPVAGARSRWRTPGFGLGKGGFIRRRWQVGGEVAGEVGGGLGDSRGGGWEEEDEWKKMHAPLSRLARARQG